MRNDQLEVIHRLSEGTKSLLRDLFGSSVEPKIDHLIELLEAGVNVNIPDLGFINAKLDLIQGLIENEGPITNLSRKVDTMSSNIDRIEKEAADAAENVGLVRTAVEDLKAVAAGMKDEIAALKEQVAQGQVDQARLDAAASTFEKADEDIDAIVLPTPAPTPES